MREGVSTNTEAVVSWKLPDGFIAFQAYDDPIEKQIRGTIGSTVFNLGYFEFNNKAAKQKHKNGIAPNWVHSFDAYLLRLIVNGMPPEAPISTVHDQFSTTSYYIEELQETAKSAYKTIADVEVAEQICNDAFKTNRKLPEVGNWTTKEIDNAEFIIC